MKSFVQGKGVDEYFYCLTVHIRIYDYDRKMNLDFVQEIPAQVNMFLWFLV